MSQLAKLGVKYVIFQGRSKIGSLGVLGIGTVSVVVKSELEGVVYALKIRRTDANRPSMKEEFRLSQLANRIGIGAKVVSCSRDIMLLEYLDYKELHDWFKVLRGPDRRATARRMVHAILNQCRKLDIMGLDHGQLSNLRKHVVVVDDYPYIIDFESASTNRMPRNVTTAAQYILIGGKMSPLVARLIGSRDRGSLLSAIRRYKQEKSDFSYAKLLETLRLTAD